MPTSDPREDHGEWAVVWAVVASFLTVLLVWGGLMLASL